MFLYDFKENVLTAFLFCKDFFFCKDFARMIIEQLVFDERHLPLDQRKGLLNVQHNKMFTSRAHVGQVY